jgi:hypothetical protein
VNVDDRLRQAEIKLGEVGQRVNDHENDLRVFASLPTELEKIRWGQEQMRESLNAAHDAIRNLSERIDREHAERVEGQADRKRELEEAQAARSKEIKVMEAERERQYLELQAQAERSRLENRRMLLGLLTIFLTSATSVAVALLSGGGTP